MAFFQRSLRRARCSSFVRRDAGFSLVELMVSLTLGLIISAGVISMFSTTLSANTEAVRIGRVTQDLRSVLDFMTLELRRAGYWKNAAVGAANPFAGVGVSGGTCITYRYDADNDGTVDNDERRGFRLKNGVIEWRKANLASAPSCSNNTGWTAISDSASVSVTALSFTKTNNCTNVSTNPHRDCTVGSATYVAPVAGDVTIDVPEVAIAISGSVANSSTSLSLSDSVLIRNGETQTTH